MPGPVALVGAGEFLPAMAAFDAEMLASTGRARPRVAILPTASMPDGRDVFERWAAMGVAHFAELGAEVEPRHVAEAFVALAMAGRTTAHVMTVDGGNIEAALR